MSEIRRVLVWSGWARLSHACVGLSVLLLLLTGWLIAESPSLLDLALDLHYLGSALLLFGLVVRAVMLIVGKEHERFSALLPTGTDLAAILATLRCYMSLGRLPLPRWYAHNPLWKPFYVLIYLVLAMLVASGAAMPDHSVVLGFYLPSVHAFWAQAVFWFTLLHILSTVVHDYRNQTADVSAMINGYRIFLIDSKQASKAVDSTHPSISIESIRKDP